ncbi:MAG: hypothetical protein WCX61_05645 [Candidatus Peribacteraceae bacterium]
MCNCDTTKKAKNQVEAQGREPYRRMAAKQRIFYNALRAIIPRMRDGYHSHHERLSRGCGMDIIHITGD